MRAPTMARVARAALQLWLLTLLLAGAASAQQNPTPYWEFRVGNWVGSAYRMPDGGFSHCAMFGGYRSGITMAIVIDAEYDTQLAIGNPEWRLEIGELYDVGLLVDDRELGRFAATPSSMSVLFIQVGQRPDVFERLRKGRVLQIAAKKETFWFELADSDQALGKLKQCVDSARMPHSPHAKPFGDGAHPGRVPAPDSDFVDAISGILDASGLKDVRFFDPAGSAFDEAALAWTTGDLKGAVFFLAADAEGADAFAKALIGGSAAECKGTFGSQTKQRGRAGTSELSEFSMACEDGEGSEFVAATMLATSDGTMIFIHATQKDPGRLREVNEALQRVIGIVWGS